MPISVGTQYTIIDLDAIEHEVIYIHQYLTLRSICSFIDCLVIMTQDAVLGQYHLQAGQQRYVLTET